MRLDVYFDGEILCLIVYLVMVSCCGGLFTSICYYLELPWIVLLWIYVIFVLVGFCLFIWFGFGCLILLCLWILRFCLMRLVIVPLINCLFLLLFVNVLFVCCVLVIWWWWMQDIVFFWFFVRRLFDLVWVCDLLLGFAYFVILVGVDIVFSLLVFCVCLRFGVFWFACADCD